MNKISKLLLSTSLLLAPCISNAQTDKSQEIFNAVEKIYNEELETDARNYGVYFRRAHLYYGQNKYLRALSDINNAIKYTPADDIDMLSQEYALRANIYIMTKQINEALADINKALEYEPTSYVLIYQKANLEFELGNYAVAKENFQRLNRIRNRSLESLIGLARVAVKESNLGLANEYVDEAVALYPAQSEAYLRRASVRKLMGNDNGAVDDIILAIAVDNKSSKAISDLVEIAKTNYNAVISGLSNAISQAPDVGVYYYLRAMIAQAHNRYVSAIHDYNIIIDRNLYNYHGINAKLSECYYSLCDYTSALEEINIALGESQNGAYYLTSSKIHLASGNVEMARQYAERALTYIPSNQAALTQSALCSLAAEDYESASNLFGELIINEPNNPVNYIIRAWIISSKLNHEADASGFLTRCISLDYEETDYQSYLGFALNLMGHNNQAKQWMDSVLEAGPNDIDGHVYYIAAALYSQLGEIEKAFECMQLSLEHGYANLYDWKVYNVANLSVAPLRNDPRFEAMLKNYDYLFN